MILRIPDCRQKTEWTCSEAAIHSACSFLGVSPPAPFANAIQGMDPATVEAVLRSVGLCVLSGTMQLSDLKHLTSTGRPVLCPVSLHGGHWVVVAGVERLSVHYQCPESGPGRMPAKAFASIWADRGRTREYVHWGIAVSCG